MPKDERPCAICHGDDTEGGVLLCEGCNESVHSHCVGFAEKVGNGWLCSKCSDFENDESEEDPERDESEEASAAAGA